MGIAVVGLVVSGNFARGSVRQFVEVQLTSRVIDDLAGVSCPAGIREPDVLSFFIGEGLKVGHRSLRRIEIGDVQRATGHRMNKPCLVLETDFCFVG